MLLLLSATAGANPSPTGLRAELLAGNPVVYKGQTYVRQQDVQLLTEHLSIRLKRRHFEVTARYSFKNVGKAQNVSTGFPYLSPITGFRAVDQGRQVRTIRTVTRRPPIHGWYENHTLDGVPVPQLPRRLKRPRPKKESFEGEVKQRHFDKILDPIIRRLHPSRKLGCQQFERNVALANIKLFTVPFAAAETRSLVIRYRSHYAKSTFVGSNCDAVAWEVTYFLETGGNWRGRVRSLIVDVHLCGREIATGAATPSRRRVGEPLEASAPVTFGS